MVILMYWHLMAKNTQLTLAVNIVSWFQQGITSDCKGVSKDPQMLRVSFNMKQIIDKTWYRLLSIFSSRILEGRPPYGRGRQAFSTTIWWHLICDVGHCLFSSCVAWSVRREASNRLIFFFSLSLSEAFVRFSRKSGY